MFKLLRRVRELKRENKQLRKEYYDMKRNFLNETQAAWELHGDKCDMAREIQKLQKELEIYRSGYKAMRDVYKDVMQRE